MPLKTVTFDDAGWKLVPVVPTADMIDVGCRAGSAIDPYSLEVAYRAMLAAAPAAPSIAAASPMLVEAPELMRDEILQLATDAGLVQGKSCKARDLLVFARSVIETDRAALAAAGQQEQKS